MPNPNTAAFPFSSPTDVNLVVASDNAQSTLSGSILSDDTAIAVLDASGFNVPCLFLIDGEIIRAENKTGNTFTQCDRGFGGTTAATHSISAPVVGYIFSYHHNQLAAEVKSMGSFLFEQEFVGFKKNENLLTYSEALENGYWTLSAGATISTSSVVLPNGNFAKTLLEGNTSGPNMVSAIPTGLTIGQPYTFSVYAQYVSHQWIVVGQHIKGTENALAWFDVQNGLVGTVGSGANALIVPAGNGWYRCIVSTVCTSDSYKLIDIALAASDGTIDYVGTLTNSVTISGAQVRSGGLDGPLTYITTNGIAFSETGSGDLILDEGTITSGIPVQHRRGTTSDHSTFTGKLGEITIDTTKTTLVVHNNSDVGGVPLAKESHTHSNATDSTPGFMSATDKTKLDSISGGTISYQTIQANGTPQTQRAALNLTSNFSSTDDGAGNRTSIDLSDSGVSGGTYTKLTVNTKGRVTAATLLSAGDIPNLTASKISDFSTAVEAIGLDQLASPASDVNVNSHKIINLADPISASDAATKGYVDSTATGLTFKAACRAASTANVNISAPGTTIDTVSLNANDRVLLKNQSDATQNGIYTFNGASTAMTRTLDASVSAEVKPGMFVLITEGTANIDIGFVLSTTGTIVLGTTNLTFVPFSSAGAATAGNGINVSGNTVSVNTASSSRISVTSGGVDLATTAVTPGAGYNTLTVDAYGRVTAGSTTNYQASNASLTSIAAVSLTGFLAQTGTNTYAARTLQPGTGIAITNGDGVANNALISVSNDTTTQRVRISKNGSYTGVRQEINFIEGAGIVLTESDNSGSNRTDVTIAVLGGGGGAPTTSQYVLLANDTNLPNERSLVVSSGLTLTDGGGGNNVTLGLTSDWGAVGGTGVTIQLKRGTTSSNNSYTGLAGEVTYDTSANTLVTHDGTTIGGTALAKKVHTHVASDVSGLAYQTIQVLGVGATVEPILDFSGLFTATDDSGNSRTVINLANNNAAGAGTYGSATQVPRLSLNAQGLVTGVSLVTVSGVAPAGVATGDLTGSYPAPSVATVGGQTYTNIASGVIAANAATASNTPSTIVLRDSSGNFTTNQVTASLVGNVTGNCSGTAAAITGSLTGDVTSTGMSTILSSTGVGAGTYGSATQFPKLTIDGKGRITTVTLQTITGTTPGGGAGGDLNGNYPNPGVATVGGATAANIATSVTATTNATNSATASTLVLRDANGAASLTTLSQSVHVVSYSATPSFNLSLGSIQQITLTGNVTSSSLSNLTAGQFIVFDIIQDSSGSRSFVWPANVKGATTIGVASNGHNTQLFYCDGTNLWAVAGGRTDLT